MDTIFAQATASGRAGVSIIRLSGVQAFGSGFCIDVSVGASVSAAFGIGIIFGCVFGFGAFF